MNSNAPNLFHYATKELAQDAALAYILAWAKPAYRESDLRLHQLATDILRALLATKMRETDLPTVTSFEIKTQPEHIDVLALINEENQNGLVLIIEDKLGTDEHSNQIKRYIETAKAKYPSREIVPVYVKTGNVSRRNLPSECGRFLRRNLLAVLDRFPNTGDTIVDNFRVHLQGWEDETNRYRHEPPSQWRGRRIEGFYAELENRMAKDRKWNDPHWEYAHNRAGEVLCFAFAANPVAQKPNEVTMYLQIDEDATRLTVRLGEWDGLGIQSQFMHEVLKRLMDNAPDHDIGIKKAGRFRGGASGAVAEVTFGNGESYLARKEGGIVDMDATMQRLDRAREFVSKVASLYTD